MYDGYGPKPYPWPEDSREERAQRVAHSYRDLVQRIAQGECDDPAGDLHRLDQHWHGYGVHWHTPSDRPLDPDEWLSATDMAHLIHRSRRDIYNWAARGNIEQRVSADGSPEYSVASVIAYQRKLVQRRHAMRRARHVR